MGVPPVFSGRAGRPSHKNNKNCKLYQFKKRMQQYSCPPRKAAGGLGGVEECCTILDKWYYLIFIP
ncbi:MAG: hypothetical protein EAZ90_01970 [Oscillatoriales cyanobacterium]|nr:MAG: hypothetical protein EAZ94_01370 [Oscillatoriales cyanobacterium]TAE27718.1 MAG: hypothetical protein EAZ93_05300 [Oscillatoriales cyanobacterium]TAE45600.1 MAG: hypothetical protein EAZ90_01970 [Oscillatoriales cyanobacterium]TAF91031.1 MAG: hypothetical protein EAZ49_07040 [Oscillatoriales cyanobacterium]TAG89568.1 MAG: hypothetical protein EAZ19_23870 [Oscillatoriales cyanobacterium]